MRTGKAPSDGTGRPSDDPTPVVAQARGFRRRPVGESPCLVPLPFERDEESADRRGAFVLDAGRWVRRRDASRHRASSSGSARALDDPVQVVAQPRVVDEGRAGVIAREVLRERQPGEVGVLKTTSEVPPVVGHARGGSCSAAGPGSPRTTARC